MVCSYHSHVTSVLRTPPEASSSAECTPALRAFCRARFCAFWALRAAPAGGDYLMTLLAGCDVHGKMTR